LILPMMWSSAIEISSKIFFHTSDSSVIVPKHKISVVRCPFPTALFYHTIR
jgi:hypothetical protein